MRMYQLVLILKSSLSEANRKKLSDTIKGWLKEAKLEEEVWGQKVLSYPIKRELSGYYLSWVLQSEEALPSDFEKRLRQNEDVLRHLLIRTK